ncbi:MAG: hypothetical protein QOD72_74 [Acidimicrobiaceae bacterium]|nr:hypothetical protein [Acidimicrobiaceae bacterium]
MGSKDPPTVPDAGRLVGLLANDERRAVFAAVVLGAGTVVAIVDATSLDITRVTRALTRLVDAGAIRRAESGDLEIDGAVFQDAARRAATAVPEPDVGDASPEAAKVLRAFVRDGRLTSIPVAHAKRLVILDRLSQDFEPGRRYSEAMVNLILGKWHADTAALRRYLVDGGFLDRADGEYWRSGGTVEA